MLILIAESKTMLEIEQPIRLEEFTMNSPVGEVAADRVMALESDALMALGTPDYPDHIAFTV